MDAASSLAALMETPYSLEQLSTVPWIAVSFFYQHQVTLRHCETQQAATFAISPHLSTDSIYVARNTALAGLDVSWTVKEDICEGLLVELVPGWQASLLPVHLVYP